MVDFISVDDTDSGRDVGPMAFARRVYKAARQMKEDGEDKTLSGMLATVKLENNQFGGFSISIGFHEKRMESDFRFSGSKPMNIDPQNQVANTATPIEELTGDVGMLAKILEETMDLNPWEFAELEAASIGGTGGLTDFEFKYESGSIDGPPSKSEFNNRLERINDSPQMRSRGGSMAD
jgi:hypothetical protein